MEKTTAVSTAERKGDWFVTYTGRRFFPLDPRVEDVDIKDIAHSLALQTRWMGHCKTFYSIASHSLACARVVEEFARNAVPSGVSESPWREIAVWALMHDAAEAYTSDIVRPIKRSLWLAEDMNTINETTMHWFKHWEEGLLKLIAERFSLPWPIPETVKEIDNRMLVTEAVHLTNYWHEYYVDSEKHWIHEKPWAHLKPYGDDHVLLHQTPQQAEEAFLALAKEYLGL